jgi:hypothetical protein
MGVPKAIFLSIASLLLTVVTGSAQNIRNTDIGSGKVGILIGLSSDPDSSQGKNGSSVSRAETWRIVRDGGGAHVAAKIPDIILPRKDGFWRAGIQATCQLRPRDKSNADDRGEIITKDIEYAVPIGQTPKLLLDYPACNAATAKRVLDSSYDPYAGSRDQNAPQECRWEKKSYMSVLPDLLSTYASVGVREACDPHQHEEYSAHVQSPDDLKADIPFGKIFGEKGDAEWARAIGAELGKEQSCSDARTPEAGGWYLVHREGRWHAVALVQWGPYTADCVFSADTKESVSHALTHAAPLPISWAQLEQPLPGVSDAYASPDGSVLVAIQSKEDVTNHQWRVSSIGVFGFSGNKVGAKLFDLPPSGIVMVEWATGAYVDKWTEVLSGFEKRGSPRPSVTAIASPGSTPAK